MRRLAALALASLCAVAFGWAALAADKPGEKSGKRLQDVEKQLERGRERESALGREAETLAREGEQLREKAIAAAKAAQDREEGVSALETRLDALNKDFNARLAALGGQRAQLVRLLATIERIAILPPEALIARPAPPADTIRSAILLSAAVPTVEARGHAIQGEIEALVELRKDIARRRIELATALDGLKVERDRLDELAERKAKLAESREEERKTLARRNARLATEAKDLRDLLERIEASRLKPAPAKPVPPAAGRARPERGERAPVTPSQDRAPAERAPAERAPAERGVAEKAPAEAAAPPVQVAAAPPPGLRALGAPRGQMLLPVRGAVVKSFGQDGGAVTEKGITLESRPGAQVVAPYDGQVAFSGPFRGYGVILIIDHGDGYHSLLVGLSRIDAVEGQWLAAGEPVGLMGQPEGAKPQLYVELRRHGKPVNPLPWLAAKSDKVGQ